MSHEEFSRAGPAPEVWTLSFLDALRRYRRVTIVGWLVTAGGLGGFLLRWSSPGVLGLADILISCTTAAAGVLLVHYGIEGLSAFIRTALTAIKQEDLAALRALMEEVDQGGWQEAFTALARLRRMAGRDAGQITH